MQTFFLSLNLLDVIEDDEAVEDSSEEDDSKLQKEYEKKNAMALRYIQQRVEKSIFPCIFYVKNAKDAWKILNEEL